MTEATSSARVAAAAARNWVIKDALPFWSSAGFDAAWGGFHERLTLTGQPISQQPRRLMVQARQIYAFSHAALLGWFPDGSALAARALEMMIARYHQADGQQGWVQSVDARTGAIVSHSRDFYAHAFALFAIGWFLRLGRNAKLEALARDTLAFMDREMAGPNGGYLDALPFTGDERGQNPHMHLLEACLALYEATGDSAYLVRADGLVKLLISRFFQPQTQILAEYFDLDWKPKAGERGRLWEPGHHFEWAWLLHRYAKLAEAAPSPLATQLYDQACKYGIDAEGFVMDEIRDDGVPAKRSRRSWPHTEGVKAAAAEHELGRAGAATRAAAFLAILLGNYLQRPVPGGWIDHLDAAGKPLSDHMPASTLYHAFLAISEATRVFETKDPKGNRFASV